MVIRRSVFNINATLPIVARLSILVSARARACVLYVCERQFLRISVFFFAGAAGWVRCVDIECSMVALAHRRGRSGASAL